MFLNFNIIFFLMENRNIYLKNGEESCFNKVILRELGKYILFLFDI